MNTLMVKEGEITKEGIDLIRKTVAKDANDLELQMFLHLAQRYGLDAFSREIMFIKRKVWNSYKQGYDEIPTFLVGRDGFLNIAHRSGQFGGIKTTPNFDEKGNLVSATCKVWNKSCTEPIEVTVYLKEYMVIGKDGKGQALWGTKPITMLSKVAECQCLRKAFSISGVYESSELDSEIQKDAKDAIEQSADVLKISEKLNTDPAAYDTWREKVTTTILDDLAACKVDTDVSQIKRKYEKDIGQMMDEDRQYCLDQIDSRLQTIITDAEPKSGSILKEEDKEAVMAQETPNKATPEELLAKKEAHSKAFVQRAVSEITACDTKARLNIWKASIKNISDRAACLKEFREYVDTLIAAQYAKLEKRG